MRSEADLISWGSVELRYALTVAQIEKTRMHSHDAYQSESDAQSCIRSGGTQTNQTICVHALGLRLKCKRQ